MPTWSLKTAALLKHFTLGLQRVKRHQAMAVAHPESLTQSHYITPHRSMLPWHWGPMSYCLWLWPYIHQLVRLHCLSLRPGCPWVINALWALLSLLRVEGELLRNAISMPMAHGPHSFWPPPFDSNHKIIFRKICQCKKTSSWAKLGSGLFCLPSPCAGQMGNHQFGCEVHSFPCAFSSVALEGG